VKIYKAIVDKKPKICMFCPLKASAVKIEMPPCGEMREWDAGDGWKQGAMCPDHRCILEEKPGN
jgi:hypothetical protein